MAHVEVYTRIFCGYCVRAKELLDAKGAAYDEIDTTLNGALKAEMVRRAGGRSTVPQIFIDGVHVGGCDDLHALDAAGRLDAMLGR
jgi:glutaredoxin 3